MSSAIFTRTFSAADFGQYALVLIVANLLSMISSQWVQQGVNRYLPGAAAEGEVSGLKPAIARSVVIAGTLGCVVSVGSAIGVGARLGDGWRPLLLAGVVLVVATSVFTPLLVVLQAEMRSRAFTAYRVGSLLLGFGLSILFVFVVRRDIAGLIVGNALGMLVLLFPLWRSTGLAIGPRTHALGRLAGDRIRQMARYGLPMTWWFVGVGILFFSDRYLIERFRGVGEVGVYSAVYVLMTGAVSTMATPVILAAHPALMAAWNDQDKAKAARWLRTILELLLVVGVVIVLFTGLFATDLARLLLGPEFRRGAGVMAVLVAAAVMWQVGGYAHKPLEFAGKTKLMSILVMVVAALDIAANVLFVPRFGYPAAAWALLGASTLYTALAAWAGRRVLPWKVRLWIPIRFAVASGASLLLVRWLRLLIAASEGYLTGLVFSIALATACAFVLFVLLVNTTLPPLRGGVGKTEATGGA
ncbi:MAG: lipopolysaccharide biosynthesis protein [Acidobacteria bacterium]|nr:MAG: lipopolysaccharide biosynthesis protein [Acidobacteriota bacterium]